jgi:hypothetical protein
VLKSEIQTGSGQVRIVESDDRGEPDGLAAPGVADFRFCATFVEKINLPLSRDATARRGSTRLGVLLLTAQVNASPAVVDYLALDVIVTGYIGSAPTVIKRLSFGPGATDDFVRLDDANNYDSIGISGRQNVNGAGDSTTAVGQLALQAVGRFSR